MDNLKASTFKINSMLPILFFLSILLPSTLMPLSAKAYPITLMNFTEEDEQSDTKPKEVVSCYLTTTDFQYMEKQRQIFQLEESKEVEKAKWYGTLSLLTVGSFLSTLLLLFILAVGVRKCNYIYAILIPPILLQILSLFYYCDYKKNRAEIDYKITNVEVSQSELERPSEKIIQKCSPNKSSKKRLSLIEKKNTSKSYYKSD